MVDWNFWKPSHRLWQTGCCTCNYDNVGERWKHDDTLIAKSNLRTHINIMEYKEIVIHIVKWNISKFESELAAMGWECCSLGLKCFRNLKKVKLHVLWDLILLYGIHLNKGAFFKVANTVYSSCRLNDSFISSLLTAMEPSGVCSCVGVGETPANTKVLS